MVKKIDSRLLSEKAKEEVWKYIQDMDLKSDTKLPREEVMADMLGVSRITIRKAFADLASEGKIFRIHGKGTFVNPASVNLKVTFNPVMEFTQMISASGYQPSMKRLGIKIIDDRKDVRKILRMKPEEYLVEVHKAFFADDKLCVFCRDFYNASVVGGRENIETLIKYEQSIYPYIYQISGHKISWDKTEIDTVLSTEIPDFDDFLKEMNVGVRPYLYLKEINFGEDNSPIIYVEEYIDTSIIKYNVIRQKTILYGQERNG